MTSIRDPHVHWVLGSSSPSRHSVFKKLGVPFMSVSPDIDESVQAGESVVEHVMRLSLEKARRVAEILMEAPEKLCPCHQYFIVSSDQVALLGDLFISKPGNEAEAVLQLKASSGRAITFYNGLCLLNLKTGQHFTALDTTVTHYKSLTEAQILSYLAQEKPYECAGSLRSEGLGIALIDRIDSKDPNSLVGLPLIALCQLMTRMGLQVI